MRFYSKKGPVFGIIMWLANTVLTGSAISVWMQQGLRSSESVIAFLLITLSLLGTVCWFTTYYEITERDQIITKSGPFRFPSIPIREIHSITPTNNPLSSPALSIDRLDIQYGAWESMLISPKDKQAFINECLRRNPDIHILQHEY